MLNFLESPSNGILIADEVGLGKTIEAGLIWTELRARMDANRLLVVCPAMLREKWRSELLHRFGIRAEKCKAEELHARLLDYADQALDEFEQEGGVAGRGGRYRDNCRILVEGMRELGFRTLLPDELQAPIIVTFHMPDNPRFEFNRFYDRLSDQGYVIYPGKLTVADSFRIGCIGRLGAAEMEGALAAIRTTMKEFEG